MGNIRTIITIIIVFIFIGVFAKPYGIDSEFEDDIVELKKFEEGRTLPEGDLILSGINFTAEIQGEPSSLDKLTSGFNFLQDLIFLPVSITFGDQPLYIKIIFDLLGLILLITFANYIRGLGSD